jgi:hypothetical protein
MINESEVHELYNKLRRCGSNYHIFLNGSDTCQCGKSSSKAKPASQHCVAGNYHYGWVCPHCNVSHSPHTSHCMCKSNFTITC